MPDYLLGLDKEFDKAFRVGAGVEDVHFLHAENVGVFVCVQRGDEMTAHPLIAENARGKQAIEAGKEVVRYWFDRGIKRLHTRCDRDLKHAMIYNYAVGLRRYGEDSEFIYYEVRA